MIGRVISPHLQVVVGRILPLFSGLGFMGLVYLYLLIYHIIDQPNGQKIHHISILWVLKLSRCFFTKLWTSSCWNVFFRYIFFFLVCTALCSIDEMVVLQVIVQLYHVRPSWTTTSIAIVFLPWCFLIMGICKLLRNGDIYHSLPQARHWDSTHP